MRDLDKGEAGSQLVQLTLSLDKNGILSVSAEYNGRKEHMTIKYSELRARCARNIEEMIEDADRFQDADRAEARRRARRSKLYETLQRVKYRLDSVSGETREKMNQKRSEVQQWYDANPRASTIDIDMKIELLTEACSGILQTLRL